jgi:hypothetical protein
MTTACGMGRGSHRVLNFIALSMRTMFAGVARSDFVAFLRTGRARRLAALAIASLLPACATTSMPSAGPGEDQGISGYVACLDAAARRMDDGRSDVASVAAAIKGVCAARFPEPTKAPGAATSTAARQKSEARQMELSTMVVQDLRGQP